MKSKRIESLPMVPEINTGPGPSYIDKVVIHQPRVVCLTPRSEIHRQLAICEFAGRRSHHLLWDQSEIDFLMSPSLYPIERVAGTHEFLSRRLDAKPPHATVIEHANVTFAFLMSRVASHEFVRHRIGSPTQSSTRYIEQERVLHLVSPYLNETVEFDISNSIVPDDFPIWAFTCLWAVGAYHALRAAGNKREHARYVLPHALATSLVHTTNLRQWSHMIHLRTGKVAAPEMQFIFGKVRSMLAEATDNLLEGLCE